VNDNDGEKAILIHNYSKRESKLAMACEQWRFLFTLEMQKAIFAGVM